MDLTWSVTPVGPVQVSHKVDPKAGLRLKDVLCSHSPDGDKVRIKANQFSFDKSVDKSRDGSFNKSVSRWTPAFVSELRETEEVPELWTPGHPGHVSVF